jgi:hypothetical protein
MDDVTNQLRLIFVKLDELKPLLHPSPWAQIAYWFAVAVSGAGVWFSLLAFKEAKSARRAAVNAGKTVKIQTITTELGEISQRLERLEIEINFEQARDFLNEITRRLRRLVAPLEKEQDFVNAVASLKTALNEAKTSLNAVRPASAADSQGAAPNAVYNAVEANFSAINGLVADIMGLCDQYNLPHGENT